MTAVPWLCLVQACPYGTYVSRAGRWRGGGPWAGTLRVVVVIVVVFQGRSSSLYGCIMQCGVGRSMASERCEPLDGPAALREYLQLGRELPAIPRRVHYCSRASAPR